MSVELQVHHVEEYRQPPRLTVQGPPTRWATRPSSLTDEKIIDLVTAIHVVEYAEDKWADNGER